ncbi:hypothetical protein JTE90_008412 [Oedothorax gibbosus]|uniref:Uncharacterized protein n=1 Tax=Oedothorax gibbosus TaxID=931172 RepID=A0AAV6V341_9ARAC|nr:hypothetical protein JTE90_008412 [Oedothorax gibbosus]
METEKHPGNCKREKIKRPQSLVEASSGEQRLVIPQGKGKKAREMRVLSQRKQDPSVIGNVADSRDRK